jgi:hypothetical protein
MFVREKNTANENTHSKNPIWLLVMFFRKGVLHRAATANADTRA